MLNDIIALGGVFLVTLAIGLIIEKVRGPSQPSPSERLAEKQEARRRVRGTQ